MVPLNQSVVVRDPEILSGEPVFRGTRVPFQALLDHLEGGETIDAFLIDFPGVSRDSAVAALEEAKALLIARFVIFERHPVRKADRVLAWKIDSFVESGHDCPQHPMPRLVLPTRRMANFFRSPMANWMFC